MKVFGRPVLMTIIFGLVCGACLVPTVMLLRIFLHWPVPSRLAIWLYLAVYGFMLAKWNKTGLASTAWPLFVPLAFAFSNISEVFWLASVLLTLSWIRSSAALAKSPAMAIGKEMFVCLGGASLVALCAPNGGVAWSLGVWLFFLVQSLWFVSFSAVDAVRETDPDPFERARKRAEDILASG